MGIPASPEDADVVLLFGGDGTVHRHLGHLVRLGLPVLVVPAGSGNDFACSLGLQRRRDSLTAWRKFCSGTGNVRAIDLGVITSVENAAITPTQNHSTQTRGISTTDAPRYFCCIAGAGLDGEVTRRANRLPRWLRGHGGYALSLAPAIFTFAPMPMKILTSDENADNKWTKRSNQPTLLVAIANTPFYGGGMKIAPQAKMDDGLLDVCIVGGVDPFKLFCLFPTVYSGRHLRVREVKYFTGTHLRVETEHPLDIYADGEYVCRTPVEVGIHPAALKIVAP